MRKHLPTLLQACVCLMLASPLFAQLAPGKVMFIAFDMDTNKGFALLALDHIPANTTIYVTDDEWDGTAFAGTEGGLEWSHTADVPAGTVLVFTNVQTSSGIGVNIGTVARISAFNPGGTDEVLYAYLGTAFGSPTVFLSALSNGGFNATNGVLTGTGLTAGQTAIEITGDEDVGVYNGSTDCNTTDADCAAMIATVADWVTQDGAGDQSIDNVFPDFPQDVPTSWSGAALPVELVSFEARLKDGAIELQWVTASEDHSSHFLISHATQHSHWQVLDSVAAAGWSATPRQYTWTWEKATACTHYFRLKMVDRDGAFAWSPVVAIEVGADNRLAAWPNPAHDVLHLSAEGEWWRTRIVSLVHGQTIQEWPHLPRQIELEGLAAGPYLLIAWGPGGMQRVRFVVQ